MRLSLVIFFLALFSAHAVNRSDCSRVVTQLIEHLKLPAAKHELIVESVWEVLNDTDPNDREQVLGILRATQVLVPAYINGRIPFGGTVTSRENLVEPENALYDWVMFFPKWTYYSPFHIIVMVHEPFHVGQAVRGELDGPFKTFADTEAVEAPAFRHQYRYTRLLYQADELAHLKAIFPSDRYELLAKRLRADNVLEWNEADQYDYFVIDTQTLLTMRQASKEFDNRISEYLTERAAKRFIQLVERALTLTEEKFLELCLAPYKDAFKKKK